MLIKSLKTLNTSLIILEASYMTKYNYDEIPKTRQAIMTFREYAENQIKSMELGIRKLNAFLVECNRRLDEMGGKDG